MEGVPLAVKTEREEVGWASLASLAVRDHSQSVAGVAFAGGWRLLNGSMPFTITPARIPDCLVTSRGNYVYRFLQQPCAKGGAGDELSLFVAIKEVDKGAADDQ